MFHRVAAAMMNVRSPCVAVRVRGTVSEMVDSDRSERAGLYMDSRPLKYSKALWLIARKVCDINKGYQEVLVLTECNK